MSHFFPLRIGEPSWTRIPRTLTTTDTGRKPGAPPRSSGTGTALLASVSFSRNEGLGKPESSTGSKSALEPSTTSTLEEQVLAHVNEKGRGHIPVKTTSRIYLISLKVCILTSDSALCTRNGARVKFQSESHAVSNSSPLARPSPHTKSAGVSRLRSLVPERSNTHDTNPGSAHLE